MTRFFSRPCFSVSCFCGLAVSTKVFFWGVFFFRERGLVSSGCLLLDLICKASWVYFGNGGIPVCAAAGDLGAGMAINSHPLGEGSRDVDM